MRSENLSCGVKPQPEEKKTGENFKQSNTNQDFFFTQIHFLSICEIKYKCLNPKQEPIRKHFIKATTAEKNMKQQTQTKNLKKFKSLKVKG